MTLLQAQPGLTEMLIPMGGIFLIFYFLLIRPQQKKQKEHEQMLEAIGRGDQVVTSGGIHGTVTSADEALLTVEVANLEGKRVRLKVDRARIERLEKKQGESSK